MALSKLGLRTVYKINNNIDFLKDKDLVDYICWLEALLEKSDVNTLEGIKKLVSFNCECPLCTNTTYSIEHGICISAGCAFSF